MKRVEMDKDITFTPEINMGRVKVRDSSDGNLFERLSTYQKGEPDKIERLRNNLDAELTFHPQLTPKSLEIASHIMYADLCIFFSCGYITLTLHLMLFITVGLNLQHMNG